MSSGGFRPTVAACAAGYSTVPEDFRLFLWVCCWILAVFDGSRVPTGATVSKLYVKVLVEVTVTKERVISTPTISKVESDS